MTELITLSSIIDYFKGEDDLNTLKKGELSYNAGRVLSIKTEGFGVKAQVQASYKDKSYEVTILLKESGSDVVIENAHCSCPRGRWICSHQAATLICASKKGISKTDLPCSWKNPKKAARKENKIRKLDELFPLSMAQDNYRATSRSATDSDRQFLFEELTNINHPCGLRWMLAEEPVVPNASYNNQLIPDILSLLKPPFDKDEFTKSVKVTTAQIEQYSMVTSGQRTNVEWGKGRHLRLTASNFGKVLDAVTRKVVPPSLLKSLKGEYDTSLSGKSSIIYGQAHEQSAIQEYEKRTGNRVNETGLWLFPCGFLGASPDGLVDSVDLDDGRGIVEIKCSYKHRDKTISEACKEEMIGKLQHSTAKSFCLTPTGKHLKEGHPYFHQIQGQLYATGRDWCDFVFWTSVDCAIIRVYKDSNWKSNIDLLTEFYLDVLIPSLL